MDGAGEASERALFARRARALPAAPVPSLEAVLAAAGAPARRSPRRAPTYEPRAAGLVAIVLVAAACVGGIMVVSARAAGQRRAPVAAADFDAAAPMGEWNASAGAVCEPAGDDDDGLATCTSVQASFVLASSDDGLHACFQLVTPVQRASPARASGCELACEEEAPMSCP
jgi:hypothetical protein